MSHFGAIYSNKNNLPGGNRLFVPPTKNDWKALCKDVMDVSMVMYDTLYSQHEAYL